MHPSSTAPQTTHLAHPAGTAAHATHPVPASPAPAAVPETPALVRGIERAIVWIGSPISLALHTVVFVAFFAVPLTTKVSWDSMFAVLTNVVSLEAIYLAIFIQMSVNRQAATLKGVEEDVGDIQEDVEELGENVEELGENVEELGENVEELGENVEELGENVEDLKEDVEDIQEDIGEIGDDDDDDSAREKRQAEMIETLTNDVKAMLKHLETLKGR
jgi:peptidoglycan hydrolase CwlO-like protein